MKCFLKTSLAFLVALFSLGASAGDADFTLINKTGYEIEAVFVAPSKQRSWGSDILGDGTLRDGKKVLIRFSKKSNVCIYDLMVQWVGYSADEDTVWERLDLCSLHNVTLRYNRKTNETTAELD